MSLYRNINIYLLVLLLCVIFAGNAHAAATIKNTSSGQLDGEQTNSEVGDYNNTERDNVKKDLLQLEKYAEKLPTIGPILVQSTVFIQVALDWMPEGYKEQCLRFINNISVISIVAITVLDCVLKKLTLIMIPIAQFRYLSF